MPEIGPVQGCRHGTGPLLTCDLLELQQENGCHSLWHQMPSCRVLLTKVSINTLVIVLNRNCKCYTSVIRNRNKNINSFNKRGMFLFGTQ